jgi:hypothetical protein
MLKSDTVLATLHINIGLGKNNPSLVLHTNQDVNQTIAKFIKEYKLPQKAYFIIVEKVKQELA